jgi:hypothetical protein
MTVPITLSKILLAILLVTTLFGSVVGFSTYMKTVPTTGNVPVAGLQGTATIPSLEVFVQSVQNGSSSEVTGIYVPGILALPVGQQPKNNAGYVTRKPRQATQFDMAEQYGTVGILAHNDLAGSDFSNIEIEHYAIVVYGDGRLEYYIINEVQKYQALSPTSTFSDFVNLDGSNERISAGDLFNRVYAPGNRLVFQTCIEAQGDASWGRMFLIAEPATSQVMNVAEQTSFLLQFASFGLMAH